MNISEIDKNFNLSYDEPEDTEWFSARELPFVTYGIEYVEQTGRYRRLPMDIAKSVNSGVAALSQNTSGGRVRFATDSPFIGIRAVEPYAEIFPHMPVTGKNGFSLYSDKAYLSLFTPSIRRIQNGAEIGKIAFGGMLKNDFGLSDMTLFFPLYSDVESVYIGLKRGSVLRAPTPYKHSKPVLFYGSSITQGGCASKPGDDYVNRLSRMLDTDIINLGFSGNAMGEPAMAEYIATLDPSVFVLDYDHNTPSPEHLRQTHYPFYKTFRDAHPTTPIILMTMPAFADDRFKPTRQPRYEAILDTYNRAKAEGDENVYFLSAYGCFGEGLSGECGTVDRCHPDSLGFLRMAELVYPLLNKLLNK